MDSARDLTDDENEAVRAVVRRWLLNRRGGGDADGVGTMTQGELADALGIKQSTISSFVAEKGRQGTSLSRAIAICRLAGKDWREVLPRLATEDQEPRERTVEPDQRYGSQMAIALVHLAREFPAVPHEKVRAAVEAACAPMKNAAPDAGTILARARAALSTQKAASKGKATGRTVDVDDDEEIVIHTKPKPKKPNR